MKPATDQPGPPGDEGQTATPSDVSSAAAEARAAEAYANEPLESEETTGVPDDSTPPDACDLGDLPDEGLTAEERLLDTIVSDSRPAAESDEPAADPGAPLEAPAAVDGIDPSGNDRAPQPVDDDLMKKMGWLDEEVRSVRDELARVTADRDDLARRLDLAAIEFERMSQEMDAGDAMRGRLEASLEAAEGALTEARDRAAATLKAAQDQAVPALKEAQEQAAKALQERDAAIARAEETRGSSQREQDHWRATVRQLQTAAERATRPRWLLVFAGAAAIAFLAAVGGYALGRASSAMAVESKVITEAAPMSPPLVVTPPVRAASTNVASLTRRGGAAPAWPVIRDPRMTVGEEPGALVIRFKNPVFARGAEILPAGRQDLRRLAAMLKPHTSTCRVEVEGHTDASPVAARVSYGSNHELGLIRARAAMEVLSKEGGLPEAVLSISSAGDTNPPFAGDSGDARRCRTVVVKLHHAKPAVP